MHMPEIKHPEFVAGTLPPPQQWEGKMIWREDLKVFQYSNGMAWSDVGAASGGGNSVGLSGVAYDGSGRVTNYTLDGIAYTVTGWGTSTVTITGSNGSVRTISFDGSGRFSGVV